jgi:hypothetical protein
MVLGIRVGTFFQEELNKVEVGHDARVASILQGRFAAWQRYSIVVEKLTDLLVLLPPIYLLTSLGTIQGGQANSAVMELKIRRCFSSADDAAPEHDCCWIRVWG